MLFLHPGPTGCPRTSSSRAMEDTSQPKPLCPKVGHDDFFFLITINIKFQKLNICYLSSFFRFCGTSKSELPSNPTSPTSSKSKFYPTEEVNMHPLLIRFIFSKANKCKLCTLHHLITRIFKKNEFYHFCTVLMFYFLSRYIDL